jgi:hypothetical protein
LCSEDRGREREKNKGEEAKESATTFERRPTKKKEKRSERTGGFGSELVHRDLMKRIQKHRIIERQRGNQALVQRLLLLLLLLGVGLS